MFYLSTFEIPGWIPRFYIQCNIVKNCYSKETVEQWSMYTLYNNLTIFSKKWLKSGLLQFLTMWILWDRKCEYGFFHITHAKNSSNHSSSIRDLTRFFGICDVEKAILTFPPQSILTPTPLCWQFFTTILWQILTPPSKVCRCLKMDGPYLKVMKWQPGIVNDALNWIDALTSTMWM